MFRIRSVADMTNIHRTKVMPVVIPPEPQPFLNHEATTCIDIAGRFEGGVYKNQERVCNPIQRRPETRRQVMPTNPMLMYSRNPGQMPLRQRRPDLSGMIQPQMMLSKQLVPNNFGYPQIVASSPRPIQFPQPFRESPQPVQYPTRSGLRQAVYQVNEENKDYQGYQIHPQAANPYNQNRDHQEYVVPQAAPLDNDNRGQPRYQSMQAFLNDDNQQAYQHLQGPVNLVDENEDNQQWIPKASTSTSAPAFNQADNDQITQNTTTTEFLLTKSRTTTSTMPPFPGGFNPDNGEFSGEQSQVCNGKAKCNQYAWTTKKKTTKKTTEEFILWAD